MLQQHQPAALLTRLPYPLPSSCRCRMSRPRLGLRISPTGSPLGSTHLPGISDENNALKTGYAPALRCRPGWLRDLGIRLDLLAKMVEPGTSVGTIDPSLAGRSGLPANTVIAAGTTDGCAAFLATGATAVGDAVAGYVGSCPRFWCSAFAEVLPRR